MHQTKREAKYQVVLKSESGEHLSDWYEADTLKAAKQRAKHLLSDEYARDCESTHDDWGTHKVEILDGNGECIWDDFR